MRQLALASFAVALLAIGCVHVHEHDHASESQRGGPPPWAPAHGYRHKHAGPDLVYDKHIGVYVVVGYPHVYFQGKHYFRRIDKHWERCRNLDKARWKTVDVAEVPPLLVKRYAKGPKHGHGHGKGNDQGEDGPAKQDD